MATLTTAKKVLRASMLKTLRSLPESHVTTQSLQITSHLLNSSLFKDSKSISCYLSMPGEVDTSSIVLSVLRSGKKLFVPKVDGGKMYMVRLYGEEDYRTLRSGVWGIKEPSWEWESRRRESATDDDSSGLDLVLMPGVAFDKAFARIGYGKGYYDTFLSRYVNLTIPKVPRKPFLAALSLEEQLLEAGEVPLELHDVKLDMIISPEGISISSP